MKKNILITGGSGFIGSNLANYLANEQFKVFVVDDLSVGSKKNLSKNKNLKFFKKNINQIKLIDIKDKIDCCIHLAAKAQILITTKNENQYFEDNVVGLQKTLNFCKNKNIKKFIFASSASVYGDTRNKKVKENTNLSPLHFYAYSKYIGEKIIKKYCHLNKINFYILRFFNIYGPKSNAVVAKFLAQYLQNKTITIYGNGKQSRDFVHVDDVIDIIKKLITKNIKSNIFNVGSSRSTKINQLKSYIASSHKSINLDKRFDDIEKSISNISKANKILKWYPKKNFKHGILDMIKEDQARLIKLKLESVKTQKKIIKFFNKRK